jgi:hypothetical protein
MTPEAVAQSVVRRFRNRSARYGLLSIALLVPCYWQPRIQAGDLSSHIYNAWLAQLIEKGQASGLTIVRQSTNILFDLLLSGLFRLAGAEWAQRAAVSLTVLIFVWGAFAFVSAAAGRSAWHLFPAIAMLAYGWVFHMGFFNFYLSMGLCFWAFALFWEPRPGRAALAAAFLVLAYTAHALPVVWTLSLLLYTWIARRLSLLFRAWLVVGSVVFLIAARLLVSRMFPSEWSPQQFTLAFGVDQVFVFDGKYYFILVGLLVVWASLFLEAIRSRGLREMVSSVPFQLAALSAIAVCILPGTVALPGYNQALVFIGERMSLGVGIAICATLSIAHAHPAQRYALFLMAAGYFVFLFRDERLLNRFEDHVDGIVAQLPRGQRVVSPIIDPGLRVNALAHMVDRACMGRCFSFANYEPSTAQFRIRAVKANPVVIEQYSDAWELQTGRHVVRDRELPLFRIGVNQEGQFSIQSLKAGVLCRSTLWEVLKNPTPSS